MRSPSDVSQFASSKEKLAYTAVAGPDKVAFPQDLGTLYGSLDRADLKLYREFYASPAASADAARAGKPLPSGTVLTMVNYKAKLDDKGEPLKDANGRFIKGETASYAVMEKRTGWGTEYPAEMRNGEWEYQMFTAEKAVNSKANIKGCFECHKPKESLDFVFTFDRLKATK